MFPAVFLLYFSIFSPLPLIGRNNPLDFAFDKLLGINKHKNKNKIKTCGEVYADSAYTNKKNDEKLSQQNNKVLHRAYRNTDSWQ
jgi:hypothetical protein